MTNPTAPTASKASGRGWAYTGLVLGGLASVAANVAHSFIAPSGAPENWTPEPGAVVSALTWPIFLFIAIEILARTPWPTGTGWNLIRWIGLPPVALVAAFVSYRHLSGLLDHYNEETLVVWFGPLAVDGLMLMATSALLATGKRHTRPDNPIPAPEPATSAPASSPTDTPAAAKVSPAAAIPPATDPTPIPVAATETSTITAPTEPAAPATSTTPNSATTTTTVTPTTPEPPAPSVSSTTAGLLPGARIIAAAHHKAHGEPITAGQLAVRMRVPTPTATDILTALTNQQTANHQPHNGSPVGANK